MSGRIIDVEIGRAYQRRRADDERERKARLIGSQGPAGPCRLIDPRTGAAIGEFRPHRFEPPAARLTLSATGPGFQIVKRTSLVKRAYRKRAKDGGRVPPIPLADYHGAVALALDLGWLSEKHSKNRRHTAAS